MSINNYRPEELTNQRKITSDAKNQGDELNVDNKGKRSSHGDAAAGVRAFKDNQLIDSLLNHTDKAYFEEVFSNLEC